MNIINELSAHSGIPPNVVRTLCAVVKVDTGLDAPYEEYKAAVQRWERQGKPTCNRTVCSEPATHMHTQSGEMYCGRCAKGINFQEKIVVPPGHYCWHCNEAVLVQQPGWTCRNCGQNGPDTEPVDTFQEGAEKNRPMFFPHIRGVPKVIQHEHLKFTIYEKSVAITSDGHTHWVYFGKEITLKEIDSIDKVFQMGVEHQKKITAETLKKLTT